MNEMNMDGCECFIDQHAIMRRLMSILRQTQTECTDGDCTSDPITFVSNAYTYIFIALLGTAFAIIMFATRPNSLRSQNLNDKPRNDERDVSHSLIFLLILTPLFFRVINHHLPASDEISSLLLSLSKNIYISVFFTFNYFIYANKCLEFLVNSQLGIFTKQSFP